MDKMKKQKYCVLMVVAGCLISLLLMIQDGEKEAAGWQVYLQK
jgi:hypothetical protein